jgi:CRP-like cAMP-binding protein
MKRTAQSALALYLDRVLLRSTLSTEERDAIVALPAQAAEVEVEHDFVRVGDHLTHACLIVDGLVGRFAQIRNGNRSIVALHIPGDMADLHSVVLPHVTWALHAMTRSTILRVPHSALRDLAARHPAIATAFWRDCMVDAGMLAQWAVNIGRKDAVARVAHLLCEVATRYAAIGLSSQGRFTFPITQTNLADAVGLTPVHLNRVLKRLKDERIATKEQDSVVVHDWDRLATMGEFDATYLQMGHQLAP